MRGGADTFYVFFFCFFLFLLLLSLVDEGRRKDPNNTKSPPAKCYNQIIAQH